MSESFVDLSCRGLPLGRRIKLTQVRPASGYLELPTPMPVGSTIVITTDDGVTLQASVTHVFEQIGGSDRVPGMTVAPELSEDAGAAWWRARVGLPELGDGGGAPTPPPRSRPLTVRPRSSTQSPPPTPAPAPPAPAAPAPAAPAPAAPVDAAPQIIDDEPTSAMESAPTPLVDNRPTIAMAPADLVALGLEPAATGSPPPAAEAAPAPAPAPSAEASSEGEGGEGGEDSEGGDEPSASTNGDRQAAVPAPPVVVGDKKPSGKKRKRR